MKAVILAGGLGRRMMPYTKKIPKPMLPLGGKPILEHSVDWAHKHGIRDIVLCVSHMHKVIEKHFGDGSELGVRIEYARTAKPMSTAGQLRSAAPLLDSTFACIYGDTIFSHSLRAMAKQHAKTRAAITIATAKHTRTFSYGVIRTTRNGSVTAWDEKPQSEYLINVGCYIMEPEIFSLIPRRSALGMDTMVAKAISRKMRIKHYAARGKFLDIGNIGVYKAAQARFSGRRRSR